MPPTVISNEMPPEVQGAATVRLEPGMEAGNDSALMEIWNILPRLSSPVNRINMRKTVQLEPCVLAAACQSRTADLGRRNYWVQDGYYPERPNLHCG